MSSLLEPSNSVCVIKAIQMFRFLWIINYVGFWVVLFSNHIIKKYYYFSIPLWTLKICNLFENSMNEFRLSKYFLTLNFSLLMKYWYLYSYGSCRLTCTLSMSLSLLFRFGIAFFLFLSPKLQKFYTNDWMNV